MPPRCESLPQRLAREQLHRDEGLAVGLVDVVNRADMRMVQRRRGARFALEPVEGRPVTGDFGGQELEGDLATEPGVFGPVDDTHPAAPEAIENPIVGDRPADHDTSQGVMLRATAAGDDSPPGL